MSAPAPVTEAHLTLVRDMAAQGQYLSHSIQHYAQQIAESEARACAWALWAITCTHHTDKQRAECPVCLVTALTTERGKLRAEVEQQCLLNGKGAEREADLRGRLERAERELAACRESLALADGTANLALVHRDAAEAELATERAKVRMLRSACERLRDCDWIITLPDRMDAVRDIARAAIDAAMKEEAK